MLVTAEHLFADLQNKVTQCHEKASGARLLHVCEHLESVALISAALLESVKAMPVPEPEIAASLVAQTTLHLQSVEVIFGLARRLENCAAAALAPSRHHC